VASLRRRTTDSRADAEALAAPLRSPSRFRLAFEYANVGIALVHLDGNIFEANQALSKIFGYSKNELERMNLRDLWPPEDRRRSLADFKRAASGANAKTHFERRYNNKAGETFCAEVTRGLAKDKNGQPVYFVVCFRDITENKKLHEMLQQQASTDLLTGVMNRGRVEERACFELIRAERYREKLSLVIMDLDGFKQINDKHGHLAGDRVLRGFCELARSCLRTTDLLGRWGGDEFVALLPGSGIHGAELLAERLRITVEMSSLEKDVHFTISVGVAMHHVGEDLSALVARADAALYRAKQAGRNRVVADADDMARESAAVQVDRRVHDLHWKESYSSGNPTVDFEHQQLFYLANQLVGAASKEESPGKISSLIWELIARVEHHFAEEEKLLESFGYPGREAHKESHRKLMERLNRLHGDSEKGPDASPDLIGFLVRDCISRHMIHEDRKYFSWLRMRQS
jgi:diguanylate cyclase (GGDEF)-like protein/PAS domain S-box-containing protein/hemerythrin-like metal-binding protein